MDCPQLRSLLNLVPSSATFLEFCGEKVQREKRNDRAKSDAPHPRMLELRKEKKQLKKDRRMFFLAGDKTSGAYRAVMAQWRCVMKEHARLARALKERAQSRFRASQQARFRADPMRFGKQLFEKKQNGEPNFSEERAFTFFSSLYRDDQRGQEVSPLPEMQ